MFPGATFFAWNYSEPGPGKGAPDSVGGTLKRTADKEVAERKDIVNFKSLKEILLPRCSSIKLFEVTTANIAEIEDLVKQSTIIAAFRGTQQIRQFVFSNDVLEFRSLSCYECEEKCKHFHLEYYKSSKRCIEKPKSFELKTRNKSYDDGTSSNYVICTDSNITYKISDYVLINYDQNVYPGEIISVSEEGALVNLGNGLKSEMNSYMPGITF